MTEYINLSSGEKFYGEKNILQSQLEILSILKRIKMYRDLRADEIALKIALKSKIEELKRSINVFEKLLPKTKFKDKKQEENINTEIQKSKMPEPAVSHKEDREKQQKDYFDIEYELNEIQKKLAKMKE